MGGVGGLGAGYIDFEKLGDGGHERPWSNLHTPRRESQLRPP